MSSLFEELDWNHSKSITRGEWIEFRVEKQLLLAQNSGRGFKPRRANSIAAWGPISEQETASCESKPSPSTCTTAATGSAHIIKAKTVVQAARHFASAGQRAEARRDSSTKHLSPTSSGVCPPDCASDSTCAAVTRSDRTTGDADSDVWNDVYALLLTGTYNEVNRIIKERRDELIPRLNETDAENNTLLHACALSLIQDPTDMEEDEIAVIMPAALPRIIRYLLDMGIEIQKNSQGQTPADALKACGICVREINELFPPRSEAAVGAPVLTPIFKGQSKTKLGEIW